MELLKDINLDKPMPSESMTSMQCHVYFLISIEHVQLNPCGLVMDGKYAFSFNISNLHLNLELAVSKLQPE